MMGTRKYLCWVLVTLMFLAAVSGGCGGGSNGSSSSSPTINENETNSETNNGNGTNDSTDSNEIEGTIEGTWKITSGTLTYESDILNFTENYIEGSASAEQFTLSVAKNTYGTYPYSNWYTITLSGTGVITNETVDGDITGTSTSITGSFTKEHVGDWDDGTIIYGDNSYEFVNSYTYKNTRLGSIFSQTFQLTSPSTLHFIQVNELTETRLTIDMVMTRVE